MSDATMKILLGVQEQFYKMLGALKKVAAADPATGARLKENVKVKLLGNLKKALDGNIDPRRFTFTEEV